MVGSQASGWEAKKKARFMAWDGFITGEVLDFKKNVSFKLAWRTKQFPDGAPDSIVTVTLQKKGKQSSNLVLEHTNIPKGQGPEYEKGWFTKYFEPMNLHFDPARKTWQSHLQPHENHFTQHAENLWTMEGRFMSDLNETNRTMTIYRMSNGKLWLHGAAAINEPQVKELESWGEVGYIVVPCALHRSDANLWLNRHPNARVIAPSGNASEKAREYGPVHATVETAAAEWQKLGIRVLTPPLKNNFELCYQLDLPNNGAALLFGDLVAHHESSTTGAGALLFGNDLGVIRAAGMPGVGFIKDKRALQAFFLQLADELDPRLSTFKGRRLDVITILHGPPVAKTAQNNPDYAHYTDPLWCLRYKIAIGPSMPENLSASSANLPDPDTVKVGFVEKTNERGGSWKRVWLTLTKDGRCFFSTGQGKPALGLINLAGAKTDLTNDKDNHKFCFAISNSDGTYYISCASQEDAKDWHARTRAICESWGDHQAHRVLRSVANLDLDPVPKPAAPEEDPEIADILGYWFTDVPSDETPITPDHLGFWFYRNPVVDDAIRSNFAAVWQRAVKGECDHWAKTARGTLALVILLDQFTRNMFRDTPGMFAGDPKAREVAEAALGNGTDRQIPANKRYWLFSPLTRVETNDEKHLERVAQLYQTLLDDVSPKPAPEVGVDHVIVPVEDFDKSRAFYAAVMPTLKAQPEFEFPGVIGFAGPTGLSIALQKCKEGAVVNKLHLAFRCQTPAEVSAWYEACIAAGAKDNGPPGPRPQYSPNYYGAFVLDPDGHNIEAVCHLDKTALTPTLPLDHLIIPTENLAVAKDFYCKAMASVNAGHVAFEFPGFVGLASPGGMFASLHQVEGPVTNKLHVGFRVNNPLQVDLWYEAALAAGGKDNGKPGPRPAYGPTFYGAFVLDPDGHNIEACCHTNQSLWFFTRGPKFWAGQASLLRRFGRFPSRNKALGRQNTPAEEEYLQSDARFFST